MRRSKKSSFSGPLVKGASAIVGGVIADYIDPLMPGKPMILGAGKVLLGGFAMMQKDDMIQGVGTGMVVNGGVQLVQSLLPAPAVAGPKTNYVARRSSMPMG